MEPVNAPINVNSSDLYDRHVTQQRDREKREREQQKAEEARLKRLYIARRTASDPIGGLIEGGISLFRAWGKGG